MVENRRGVWSAAWRWLSCALALALTLIGCGNGGDGGSTEPPPAAAPPTIITQPQAATVPDGSSATFSVVASGSALTFQWRRNGAAIAGATGTSHTTPANTLADSGAAFSVVVSAAGVSVTSSEAALTVSAVAPTVSQQPQAASVVAGQTASFSVVAAGSAPLAYQWRKNGTAITGATAAQLQVQTIEADDGARFSVVVSNAGGSTTSGEAALAVTAAPTPPSVATAPASSTVNVGASATFSVVAQGTAPLAYQWLRNGSAIAGATAATHTTPAAALADSGARYAVAVSNPAGQITSPEAVLTVLPPAPTISQQPASLSVTAGQAAAFSVVAAGTGPITYQWSRGGVLISGAAAAGYTLPAAAISDNGAVFIVAVSNAGGTTTSSVATLTVTPAPEPPGIAAQPQPQSVAVGQTATFSVAATGTPPFSYQWQKNGTAIAGATAVSYTTPATTLADSGAAFRVVVGNVTGTSVTSNAATLTVAPDGPTITAQPQPATVLIGRPVSFSVTAATANGPLSYQWRRGNADIAGETGPSYTLQRTVFADHGVNFSVLVRDARGTVLSNSVTLGITPIGVESVVGAGAGLLTRNADGSVWMVWDAPGVPGGGPRTLTPLLLRDGSGFVVTGYAQLSAGWIHALAVDGSGGAWAWGEMSNGKLGDGSNTSNTQFLPVRVRKLDGTPFTGVASVQAGRLASFAVMADGTARGWGYGPRTGIGQNEGPVLHPTPIVNAQAAPLSGVVRIVSSPFADHALALLADGTLWGWGNPDCNYSGVASCLSGDGTVARSVHAVQLRQADGSAILAPRSMAVGPAHTAVVQSDGTVLAWGLNAQGQLGDGSKVASGTTVLMRTLQGEVFGNVSAVVAARGWTGNTGGGGCTVLLRTDGSVWATGENTYGCIGDGGSVDRTVPVPVLDGDGQPLTGVVALSASGSGVVAKKADGSYWAWGDITFGGPTGGGNAYVWRSARRVTGFAP